MNINLKFTFRLETRSKRAIINCSPREALAKRGEFEIPAYWRTGQALVVLLVFVATATIITAAAVTVTIINSQATGKLAVSEETLAVAEGGAEYTISRILLNPSYQPSCASPEVLSIGSGTATICISGTSTKTITVTGQVGSLTRKIRVVGNYSNLNFAITSWQEI